MPTRDELAARLLTFADQIDPGLEKGGTFSVREGTRRKLEDVRDHAIACGIRMALDELGLMPDDD